MLMSLYHVTLLFLLTLEHVLQAPAECRKSLKLNAAGPTRDQEGNLPSCSTIVVAAIEAES